MSSPLPTPHSLLPGTISSGPHHPPSMTFTPLVGCFLGARCCAMMFQTLCLILTAPRQALLFCPILQRSKLRPRREVLYPRPALAKPVFSGWVCLASKIQASRPGVQLLWNISPGLESAVTASSPLIRLQGGCLSPFCPYGHLSRTAAGRP